MHIPGGYEKSKENPVDDFFDEEDDDDDVFESYIDYSYKQQNTTVSASNQFNSLFPDLNNNKYDEYHYILEEIKSCILNQNLVQMISIMKKHAIEINCKLKSDWTPLMYAVNIGAFEIVQYLLKNSADVSYAQDSYNVIMCASGSPNASEYNQIKIIELLLKYGADTNSCDKYNQTPLMYACRAKNHFLIDLLVNNGAKLNAQDDNGWTSLSHASHNGCLKSIKKLLQHGADPLICAYDYLYPFDLAQKNSHKEIYQVLTNYLRMKKIKNSNQIEDYYDDDDNSNNDLVIFLSRIGLKRMQSFFKVQGIDLKSLLNCSEQDLNQMGIQDKNSCQVILTEIKKFHQKNWSSSSIALRSDSILSCTEVLAVVSNLSRQIDFMEANVKFIQKAGVEANNEFFVDECSNAKLKTDCELAIQNCRALMSALNLLSTRIQYKNASPIDEAKPKRFDVSQKFLITSVAVVGAISVLKVLINWK